MPRLYRSWMVGCLAVLLWPAAGRAQIPSVGSAEPVPNSPVTTELRTQFSTSYNNPGLQQSIEWSKRRLTRPGTGPMTAEAHISFGSQAVVSPSFARLGVWAQYAPLSILTLRAGAEPTQFFGTFDSLMSFARQDAAFDNDTRRERGGAAPGRALRVYATPTVRVRARRVVAMVSGDFERWYSSAPGPWFYEPMRDTLLESNGSDVAASRAVVMYEHVTAAGTRLGLGGLHTLQEVDSRALNKVQRAGAIGTLQSDGSWRFLNRPAMTLIVARYLDDPSKDGGIFVAFTLATTLRRH
jgi:hypothetical protein